MLRQQSEHLGNRSRLEVLPPRSHGPQVPLCQSTNCRGVYSSPLQDTSKARGAHSSIPCNRPEGGHLHGAPCGLADRVHVELGRGGLGLRGIVGHRSRFEVHEVVGTLTEFAQLKASNSRSRATATPSTTATASVRPALSFSWRKSSCSVAN